jgi:protoporphyrinogen oxidase
MAKKRVIVLGAGLSGLSAAWHLQKKGIECLVFEKEKEPGGLCRSKKINGFTFDYDGHLLHFKRRSTYNFITKLLGIKLIKHKRNSFVRYLSCDIPYPFQANFLKLPFNIAQQCLSGFAAAQKNGNKKDYPNFKAWAYGSFGRGIAEHFMLAYNEKFWTIPANKLTCEWLDGFIPVPALKEILPQAKGASPKRQFGYNARFWYPEKGGIGQLPLVLSERIKNIVTGCDVCSVDLANKNIKLKNGQKERFDYLISTIPLPELSRIIKDAPSEIKKYLSKLRWNSIFNLNLGIDRQAIQARHWVYFPQPDISFFRVGFFHNFSSNLAPKGKNSLYIEVSFSSRRPLEKDIIPRIKRDLIKTGLLGLENSIYAEDANYINYGYPIYDHNYKHSRQGVLSYLGLNNIISCGRYGSWRYMTMEDALLDGQKAASLIL